jgi:hypothetical protein
MEENGKATYEGEDRSPEKSPVAEVWLGSGVSPHSVALFGTNNSPATDCRKPRLDGRDLGF